MASNPIGREAQPVTLPGTIPPMPAVARILSRYDRGKLAAFVTVAIDLLDVLDGDVEAEDGNDLEDDFSLTTLALLNAEHGAGCKVSDPGGGNVDDEGEAIDEREREDEVYCRHYGIDQDAPVGETNPLLI